MLAFACRLLHEIEVVASTATIIVWLRYSKLRSVLGRLAQDRTLECTLDIEATDELQVISC